ncbi:MAG: aminotransferase class V-fold PLP-dependent enzyme, partial [Acidobacteria bacterium]|nr:aminotransferase class V-fold PLP-dependent enzyme [Acidobacteriota bacterium]
GPRAGGIVCQGGSQSNLTSLVIARGALYPETKVAGNVQHDFALFTSSHGHYSVEKAAVTCGMGNASVRGIAVDESGCMRASALREAVIQAKSEGKTPLYVNATAGTTVMGSFDPFEEISAICKEFGMWMHVDGSWGGPTVFSKQQRHKLRGSHLADSLTVNPHKMINVPVTCSFLLTNDLSRFHRANTLPAGYLFHSIEPDAEVWDLADLTLQCGRRGDAVKLALAWTYYGADGFERQVDAAFETAGHLASIVKASPELSLVSSDPPPCLQVCFYHAPGGKVPEEKEVNTARTAEIVRRLVGRGFMVDYAPGPKGSFFRIVVNTQTLKGTVEGLVKAILAEGKDVV